MCGIAGLFNFNELEISSVVLPSMVRALHHRGPDGQGFWMNEGRNVGLGHARLAILDVSENGKQPMHLGSRYSITYNGEIYNYLEIREKLISGGHVFHTGTDTEVLLALYQEKGEEMLHELDGMFAFAIWDEREQELFCARDRFGEKPFYYHHSNQVFVFASEVKAIFQAQIDPQRDMHHIFNYLFFGTIENPLAPETTFFKNVHQLQAGHFLKIKKGSELLQKKYWELKAETALHRSEEEMCLRFQELFKLSISRRLRSDVPVGSSLSGGLDSSAIVLMIDKIKGNNLQKTFSARFENFAKDEGKFMHAVINKASAVEPHFIFPTSEDILNDLPDIFYHQEEPVGSASIAVQFEVMKLAKQNNITVLLDGQGADELLAGYPGFWKSYLGDLLKTDKKAYHSAFNACRELQGVDPFNDDFEFRLNNMFPQLVDLARKFRRKLIPFSSPYFRGIHPDLCSLYSDKKSPIVSVEGLKSNLNNYLSGRGLNELLHYADRNAMAHSVEVRLPFLFHELAQFTMSVPDDMLLRNGWTKFILRQSLKELMPDEITWRKDKIGYEPPQDTWMKDHRFIELTNVAVSWLLKEQIIIKSVPGMEWMYISLYYFFTTDYALVK